MIFFPNKQMQRYTYTAQEGAGVYGETVYTYEYVDTITVDFQNESNAEIMKQYGEERGNLYTIHTDLQTNLNSNDRLVDERGNVYTITGEVMEYDHFHNYKVAHLIHERQNAPMSVPSMDDSSTDPMGDGTTDVPSGENPTDTPSGDDAP